MTREEEIEKVLDDKFDTDLYDYKTDNSYCNYCAGFIQGVEWADKHPNSPWISVKEKLPTDYKEVFVCYKSPIYGVNFYDVGIYGDKWLNTKGDTISEVIYWMPISKLPKE